jgi:hypothetical protein
LLNVVLLAVVLVQGWMLHRPGAIKAESRSDVALRPVIASGMAPVLSADVATPGAHGHDPLAMAVMDRLERIEARLAGLESARGFAAAAPSAPAAPERLDPRGFAEADRRLDALLPDRDLDAMDWVRWQATLAALPAAEHHAVSAAFSRAGNRNRIRLQF